MPFNVSPTSCELTYRCNRVYRVDGFATNLNCDRFTVDDKLLGGPDDGKISVTISPTDYTSNNIRPGDFKLELCAYPTDARLG